MGFYDTFQGGLIGGGKQNEYGLPGIQSLNDSSIDIARGDIDLHLDAANPLSYPGTGTTWTDLSGNARNGTLTNGPTFTADLGGTGGYITTDGVNDLITVGQNFNYTTQAFSIGMWIYPFSFDATGGINVALFWKGSFNVSGYYAEINPRNGNILFYTNQGGANQLTAAQYNSITQNPLSKPNSAFLAGNWYHLFFVRIGNSVSIYVNGVNRVSVAGIHGNPASASGNTFQIARYEGTANYSNIAWASFIIYQRAISLEEIRQNFNASRKRFGL